MVVIREGNKGDIVEVSYLWQSMVLEMKPEYTPNIKWWQEIAAKVMETNTYFMFVAEEDRLIGFLDFFIFPEPSTGQIHCVGQHQFLLRSYRGSSVGRDLYNKTIEFGKRRGINIFELLCFDNEKCYWENKGFRPLRSFMRMEINHV